MTNAQSHNVGTMPDNQTNNESTFSITHSMNNFSEAYLAAKALLKPDAYDTDPDICEIFNEEAEEVFADMAPRLAAWQADTEDMAMLKEIRRGFHTLKGSGRMVGAFQLGEAAWSVESMLNRVLEGTLPVSSELVEFLLDTYQKLPRLVADFAAQHEPSVDPALIILQAQQLTKQQPMTEEDLQSLSASRPANAIEESEILTEDMAIYSQVGSSPVISQDASMANESVSLQPAALMPQSPAFESPTPSVAVSMHHHLIGSAIIDIASLPTLVQQAYYERPELIDNAMDADIQEIYIEEVHEVIETVKPIFIAWEKDSSDIEALKEIRRAFHTLKGSGRMVGANQLGELAWSIEQMLNRVLENSLVVDDGMRALIGDVINAFEDLLTVFEQNRQDYPAEVRLWATLADMYTKQLGDEINYFQIMNSSTQVAVSPVHDSTEYSTATKDDTLSVVSAPVVNDNDTITDTVIDTLTDSDDYNDELIHNPRYDDDFETDEISTFEQTDGSLIHQPTLVQDEAQPTSIRRHDPIFLEEAQELLTKIDQFIIDNQNQSKIAISDSVIRAFHTLRGGAALSKLPRVYELSAALEKTLSELLRKETVLDNQQLMLIAQAKADLQQYFADYQDNVSIEEHAGDSEKINELTQHLLSNISSQGLYKQLTVKELLELGINELLDSNDTVSTLEDSDTETIVQYANIREQQAYILSESIEGLSYVTIVKALQNAYAKLALYPQFVKNKEFILALQTLHGQLLAMFDAIAAGLQVRVDDESIQHLTQLISDIQLQADMAAIEYESIVTDVELLSIFLDEVKGLDVEIQQHFRQWQNNLTNFDAVKELQRHFHTLKGGANMAAIQSVATLAHRGERLYQAIAQQALVSDPDLVLVMQRLYETVTTQLEQIKQRHRSFFADQLIQQLDAILAQQLSPRNLVLIVPPLVDISLQEAASKQEIKVSEDTPRTAETDALYVQEVINNFEQRRLETWQGAEPDKDILNVFLEEAKELIDSSSLHLQEFRNNTSNIAALQALQRELHTIKGGARMVGAEGIANLAHEMETIYEELGSRRKPATRMIGNLLAACHDWLAASLTVLENNYNPQSPSALIEALQEFSRDPDSLKDIPVVSLANQIEQIAIYKSSLARQDDGVRNRDLSIMPATTGNFEVEQEQTKIQTEMLRVPANLMERMINLSGESAINRSRIEMGISSLSNSIEEMGSTVQRLADQLRRMETELEIQILAQIGDEHDLDTEFDPLEMDQYSALNQLSKSLSESASDLLDIKTTMLERTRDTENLLLQLSRTQTDLQEGLMNSRTVPFSRITSRLQRIARQTATELGKSVELRIINDEDEIDRTILERITSPLEHMLRNAIDHGIEKPQERLEMGKSRTGLITLEVMREGGEIVIHLTDDGKGINVDAVRKKAIEQGLLSANDTTLKELDIMQYIFNAGLSTAKTVSQISGRGVGMDVVQSEVKQLGGLVLVDSDAGYGSRFTMRLPLTVAVSDALMVRAADKYFAIPLVQIERVVRVNTETIHQFYVTDATTLDIDGQNYRLRYLNQILYGSEPSDSAVQQALSVPVIIIRTETGQRMALQVDAIAGSRIEVVVKPLGRQLSHIAGISAATIMADGSVMLILDLIALMRNASNNNRGDRKKSIAQSQKTNRKPLVFIVDDSVTVRKVTSRLLERNGYDVQVAMDGVDALEKLQEMTPDLMLLDIEMPRMDGFELAQQVRYTNRLKDIPIIMITSRTGEKHRERAFSIGVNAYMGKPFQEQALLDAIVQLVPQHA